MMTRVGLDASHTSKAQLPGERKTLGIKVSVTKFAEGRFSLRLIALG